MYLILTIVAIVMAATALRRGDRAANADRQLKLEIERLSNEVNALKSALRSVPPPQAAQVGEVSVRELEDVLAPEVEEQVEEDAVEPERDPTPHEPEPKAAASSNRGEFQRIEDLSGVAGKAQAAQPAKRTLQDIEQFLAGRWFVVLGGIAIALAGLLFVKYAHDNGLIPPWLRVIAGYAFAGALVAGGEYIRRHRNPAISDYVPAALSAAGIVTAFGVTYAAYALYGIFSPGVCFPLLVAIGLGALWLSRLQGPLIAALGLVGSYAAPALVPSDHPSAWGFFFYLIVIAAACFYELRNRPWWWLGYSAIAGALAWAALWIAGGLFNPSDVTPTALFAFALALSGTFIPRGMAAPEAEPALPAKQPNEYQMVAATAGAAATLILMALVFRTQHGATALAFFAAGMAAVSAFGWLRSQVSLAAPIAAIISFAVLMAWPDVSALYPAFDDRGFWTLVPGFIEPPRFVRWMIAAGIAFTLLGLASTLRKSEPHVWAGLAAASAVTFLFGAWARSDFVFANTTWIILALAFAAVLLGAGYRLRARVSEPASSLSIDFLAVAAALLLLFAADRMFDSIWYTLAIATLALASAFTVRKIDHRVFGIIAAAFATFASIRLFLSREFWIVSDLPWGDHWPLYGYGLPAAAFWLAARFLPQQRDDRPRISLEGMSLGLLISLASIELRILIGGGVTSNDMSLLELASHATTWLAAAFGLAYRQKVYSGFIARWGTLALTAAASGVLVILLLPLNPAITGDTLAGNAVVNSLWLAYALPAVLLYLIMSRLSGLGWQMFEKPVAGFIIALGVAFVSLSIRRWFHGPALDVRFANFTEICVMVLAWLACAIAANERNRTAPSDLARWTTLAFAALAACLLLIALTVENPVFGAHALLPNALINQLWLAYFVPAALLVWLINRNEQISQTPYREAAGVLAFVLVMAFVTLMVKRAYQGPLLDPRFLGDAENYTVSFAWLVTGVLAFVGGLKFNRQYIRVIALGVLALTVLKVFVYDFSELSGLWRIASLLGLGLCLVGIGWLYSRFVHGTQSPPAEPAVET